MLQPWGHSSNICTCGRHLNHSTRICKLLSNVNPLEAKLLFMWVKTRSYQLAILSANLLHWLLPLSSPAQLLPLGDTRPEFSGSSRPKEGSRGAEAMPALGVPKPVRTAKMFWRNHEPPTGCQDLSSHWLKSFKSRWSPDKSKPACLSRTGQAYAFISAFYPFNSPLLATWLCKPPSSW